VCVYIYVVRWRSSPRDKSVNSGLACGLFVIVSSSPSSRPLLFPPISAPRIRPGLNDRVDVSCRKLSCRHLPACISDFTQTLSRFKYVVWGNRRFIKIVNSLFKCPCLVHVVNACWNFSRDILQHEYISIYNRSYTRTYKTLWEEHISRNKR